MVGRSAKSIASQGSEPSLVGTAAAGQVDGNRKEGSVVCTQSEIVFSHLTLIGKNRNPDLVRPISASGAEARLFNSREYGEGRPAGQSRDIQQLPACG